MTVFFCFLFRRKCHHRQFNYIRDIVAVFRLDEFFRVGRGVVQTLSEYISETCVEQNISSLTGRRGSGGSPQTLLYHRILLMLWFMASLDKFASIADRFGISESTACAVHDLVCFIHEFLLDKIVVWPTADEQQEMKHLYVELKKFPGVIGMIDGTHIQIKKPSVRGIDYYNRKDYYSIVLQAVVREDMRFTHVYAGWPGKVHDARIFKNSELYANGLRMCGEGHILGDSAYPNLPFVLTPFRDNGHLTRDQKKYNQVHSSIRVTVERAFGLLKGRFVWLQNMTACRFWLIRKCELHIYKILK